MENWKERVQFALAIFGIISFIGYFTAYYILTSYLAEIQFSVTSISTHILFSVVKNGILFYSALFIIMMYGSFLSYGELSKEKYRPIMMNLWWTSSSMLIILYSSYFCASYVFELTDEGRSILLLSLMVVLTVVEYYIVKKISNSKDFFIVFWQMFNGFMIVGFLLLLFINSGIEWGDIFLILLASLVIHSYPYFFTLFSSKSWIKYSYISIVVFSLVIFTISPNSLKNTFIRDAQIGGQVYKSIKVTDKECNYLNKYYDNKPCKKNTLTDIKGLWMQGDTYLFTDKSGNYKINRKNIIYKIKEDHVKLL